METKACTLGIVCDLLGLLLFQSIKKRLLSLNIQCVGTCQLLKLHLPNFAHVFYTNSLPLRPFVRIRQPSFPLFYILFTVLGVFQHNVSGRAGQDVLGVGVY